MDYFEIFVNNLTDLLSKENFTKDTDLASNVKGDFTIPLEYIMQRLQINDSSLVQQIIDKIPNVNLVEHGSLVKVRFPHETIILSDVPSGITSEDVLQIIPIELHKEIKMSFPNSNNTFYIKFKSESALNKAFQCLCDNCTLKGVQIKARLKNESPIIPSVPYIVEQAYGYKYGESINSHPNSKFNRHKTNLQPVNVIKKGNDAGINPPEKLIQYDDGQIMNIIKDIPNITLPVGIEGEHSVALNDKPNQSLVRTLRSDSIDLALSHLNTINPLDCDKNETNFLYYPYYYPDDPNNNNNSNTNDDTFTYYPSEVTNK